MRSKPSTSLFRSCCLVFLGLCIAYGAGCVEPRSQLNAGRGVASDTLRVLAYNIHHAEGMDDRIELDRIAALINSLQPDLVALQEVDASVERTGFVDQASVLAELTDLTPAFGSFMPYQGGEYGMAILSRWHIITSRNVRLPDGEEPRSSITVWARSPETGQDVVFSGIHFYRTEEERLAQARVLVEELEFEEAPVILAGDFNSQPDSPVIEMLARDWVILDKGQDHFTFPSYGAEREIDYIMYRTEPRLEVISHRVLDDPVMSDHRPIYAEFVLRSIAQN